MIPAPEALQRMRDGNHRFVHGLQGPDAMRSPRDRAAFVDGQSPFAVVLGCSDSRVPVELVFDQGLGDLFVIRVAGNVVAPSIIGSVEFAAERFGTRLVIVLGHTRCGAVTATLEALDTGSTVASPNIGFIVERIRPAVEHLFHPARGTDAMSRSQQAVRANVMASVDQLRHGSETLERLIRTDGLVIVGAEYSLESGVVEFLESSAHAVEPDA